MSAIVPLQGRVAEWTTNPAPPFVARRVATVWPSDWSVHQPSATYRSTSSAGTSRKVQPNDSDIDVDFIRTSFYTRSGPCARVRLR